MRHAPLPSHVELSVARPSVQLAGLQMVVDPGKVQAARSVPSHAPAQAPSPVHGRRAPTGEPFDAVQVPWVPAMLHAAHCCSQLSLQQKPSTQNPDLHEPADEQLSPSSAAGLHSPPTHSALGTHSALLVQASRHFDWPHT